MSELYRRSLGEHIESLQKREYSSHELTLSCLEHIEECEPRLNAFITLCAQRALAGAEASDRRRSAGTPLSPIDGIPYAAKDNISTTGILTTCASRMLQNYIPPYNATLIDKLGSCGALLLGKTNLDEFAMGIGTCTSYFGATKNPYDSLRVAGGSSGGSAAAVAEYLPFALGSDTGGSVRQPAAFCRIVGLRPTYGTLSRFGLISFAPSLDQIGLLTRNAADSALLLTLLAERDARDETSLTHLCKDFCTELYAGAKGLKIGVLSYEGVCSVQPTISAGVASTAAALSELGAELDSVLLPHLDAAYAAYYTIACAEASSNLARFDGVRYGHRAESYTDIESLYRNSRTEGFGDEVKRRIMFGTLVLSNEYSSGESAQLYREADKMRGVIARELDEALSRFDILLMPTAPTEPYLYDDCKQSRFAPGTDDIFCTLASLAGLPALSVPAANTESCVGVQLVGKRFSEPLLLAVAKALEVRDEKL